MFRYLLLDKEKEGVKSLIRFIEHEQHMLEAEGSCGDGMFDTKQRRNEIDRCKVALTVITEISGVE